DTLTALTCMEHRGGCCADQESGDGAGIMTAIPWGLLQTWANETGIGELIKGKTGVAMAFLPQATAAEKVAREQFESAVAATGLTFLGWRDVPVAPETLGPLAREFQPAIAQAVVSSTSLEGDALERALFLARRRFEKSIDQLVEASPEDNPLAEAYICSFSDRTIVYKGMVRSEVLGQFYKDLQNPAYESAFAVYHRRFSTNTLPKWPLAHPMRLLGHNGEINTLVGNINWMKAREANLHHPSWGEDLALLKPVVNADNSDSANLDNAMELLVRTGRSPAQALTMLVPEAYKNQPELADYPEIVDYYEYYSSIQEPWDGPALVVFCDGKQVGATLDRNGLRPARYVVTKDGYVIVSSEAGVVDIPVEDIVEKGRLGPGQMLAVDFEEGHEILKNWDIKKRIAQAQPYGKWLAERRQEITPQLFSEETRLEKQDLLTQQTAFGFTAEDVDMVIQDMAAQGKEPTFCMGNDTPLAVLSEKPHLLYDYFKQRFAQVTNPPIDPLRERLVMSLTTQLGAQGNLLEEHPEQARLLKLSSPMINDTEMEIIRTSDFAVGEISTLYAVESGPQGLEAAVKDLCDRAVAAVESGSEILVLSDRIDKKSALVTLSEEQTYIPPFVAVGAVHHHLIKQGLRMQTSIIVDTAQCWSTHHFACLLGYGATAICPYLTLESVRHWWSDAKTQKQMNSGKLPVSSLNGAQANYRKAVENGLLKILSKMGISLLSSYRGAQIFEAVGIGTDLKELAFKGSVSRLGGLSIEELAQETMSFHAKAFPELTRKRLENVGFVQSRPSGEYHMNNPAMTKLLHKAVASKQYDHYEVYREQLKGRPIAALRDLLDFKGDRKSVPLAEVESVESIMQRFCTGGMSLGSLSREAHETLGIAMNRIGGKSNSGEGGEDAVRFKVLDDVDSEGLSATLP
ncbi:MAG: glutamate synthase central domain-containing protein, partial [Cyanobacteria bacterium J06649_4]